MKDPQLKRELKELARLLVNSLGDIIKIVFPFIKTAIKSINMSEEEKKKHADDIATGWYLLVLPLVPIIVLTVYLIVGGVT